MEYVYLLQDENGVSNSENEILLPIGTVFSHEFGTYKVTGWFDIDYRKTDLPNMVDQIECDRISGTMYNF